MAILDWSQCPAVESAPGRFRGSRAFSDTRMPECTVFENLDAEATTDQVEKRAVLGISEPAPVRE